MKIMGSMNKIYTGTMTWKTAVEKKLYESPSKYTYVKFKILTAVSL